MVLSQVGFAWACVGCFGGTMLSAVVPWVSAELLVLSLPALAVTTHELGVLVVIATVGQMLGKCFLYWAARRTTAAPGSRAAAVVARWGGRFMDRPAHATGLVLVSSSLGLPPFFGITLLAGAMKMKFSSFVLAGTAGRLVHFSLLAWAGSAGIWG
jgi:membrane protein YqaA with SNARE-associated domain